MLGLAYKPLLPQNTPLNVLSTSKNDVQIKIDHAFGLTWLSDKSKAYSCESQTTGFLQQQFHTSSVLIGWEGNIRNGSKQMSPWQTKGTPCWCEVMDVPSAFSRRHNPHSKSRYNLSTFLQGFLSLGYRCVWRWLHWDPAAQLSVLSVVVFGDGLCLLLREASLVRVRAILTCGDKYKCFQCKTTLV